MALKMKNTVWVLCDTGADFQPVSFFMRNIPFNATKVSSPRGYMHWLQIWEEGCGAVEVNVFYPKRSVEGEEVKVQISINGKNEFISWIHGAAYLFANEVLTRLQLIDDEFAPGELDEQ